jgi:hypothetical protein
MSYFKTQQTSYLKYYDFLVYKIEFKNYKKNIVPPVLAAVAHKLKRWGSSAPGLRGADGSTPPRRAGEQKTEGRKSPNIWQDSRKRPKLKRNHKQNALTIKLYRLIRSVQTTTEKFRVDIAVEMERDRERRKTVASSRRNAYCSPIEQAGNQYFVPLIGK